MKKALKHVDISDLIKVKVFKTKPSPGDPAPFKVLIESMQKTKKVVFDESSLNVLNEKITEKASNLSAYDPKTVEYISEFVTRMVSALYKNGLVALEDITDEPEDPYKSQRLKYNS